MMLSPGCKTWRLQLFALVRTATAYRRLVILLFAMLLLAMQHEGFRHAFWHVAAAAAPYDHIAEHSLASACDECALLAAGADVAVSGPELRHSARSAHEDRAARGIFHKPRVSTYYLSRAPPLL